MRLLVSIILWIAAIITDICHDVSVETVSGYAENMLISRGHSEKEYKLHCRRQPESCHVSLLSY